MKQNLYNKYFAIIFILFSFLFYSKNLVYSSSFGLLIEKLKEKEKQKYIDVMKDNEQHLNNFANNLKNNAGMTITDQETLFKEIDFLITELKNPHIKFLIKNEYHTIKNFLDINITFYSTSDTSSLCIIENGILILEPEIKEKQLNPITNMPWDNINLAKITQMKELITIVFQSFKDKQDLNTNEDNMVEENSILYHMVKEIENEILLLVTNSNLINIQYTMLNQGNIESILYIEKSNKIAIPLKANMETEKEKSLYEVFKNAYAKIIPPSKNIGINPFNKDHFFQIEEPTHLTDSSVIHPLNIPLGKHINTLYDIPANHPYSQLIALKIDIPYGIEDNHGLSTFMKTLTDFVFVLNFIVDNEPDKKSKINIIHKLGGPGLVDIYLLFNLFPHLYFFDDIKYIKQNVNLNHTNNKFAIIPNKNTINFTTSIRK